MLKKSNRLPARIRVSGSLHLANPFFTVRYAKNDFEESRFAFIISKKVDSKAVIRNRIRRQFSEGIKNLLVDIKPGFDFIFIVKKEILDKTTAEIQKEIKLTLKKGEIIK